MIFFSIGFIFRALISSPPEPRFRLPQECVETVAAPCTAPHADQPPLAPGAHPVGGDGAAAKAAGRVWKKEEKF